VSAFLNSIFGDHPAISNGTNPALAASEGEIATNLESGKKNKRGKTKAAKGQSADYLNSIATKVMESYRYELPPCKDANGEIWYWQWFSKMSLLRSICLKTGLRIKSREYDFTSPSPLSPSDICDFAPLVYHVTPRARSPVRAMETGLMCLQLGQFEIAFSGLNEALGMFHQIMGPMNKEVATCFSHIGNILYYSGNVTHAMLHHHKALLISRRVLGLDHSLTSHMHQYLGLLCHSLGRNELALAHFKRAHYLMKLVSGFDHPEACISLANVGMMWQEIGDHLSAVKCLKEALYHSEQMLGSNHSQFIQQNIACCHAISVSLSQLRDFKTAVTYQRKVYEAHKTICGSNEAVTTEAEKWLSTLLKLAVEAQKAQCIAAAPKPGSAKVLVSKGKRMT
jgi:hypothetical protein